MRAERSMKDSAQGSTPFASHGFSLQVELIVGLPFAVRDAEPRPEDRKHLLAEAGKAFGQHLPRF